MLSLIAGGLFLSRKVSARLDQLDKTQQEAVARNAAALGPKAPPALVQPQPSPAWEEIHLTGTLKPEAEVDLGFKLPGRVLEIHVQRGDVVHAGQTLARLNDRDLEAQAAQARAGMQAAKAQKEMATDVLRRSKSLALAGAASEQQVVAAGSQSSLGQASIAQAEASSRLVDAMRQETHLITPIDGVVVRAPTAPGFFAPPGQPIFRIEKLNNLRFSGAISDRDAARVEKGADLRIRSDAGVLAQGQLDLLIPSVDPMTRRVPIEGKIPNLDGRLFAGSFVDATLMAKAETSVRVPLTALLTGDEPAVLVLGPDRKLQRRTIEVLRTDKEFLLIRAGLQVTDQVVANPGTQWRQGDSLP